MKLAHFLAPGLFSLVVLSGLFTHSLSAQTTWTYTGDGLGGADPSNNIWEDDDNYSLQAGSPQGNAAAADTILFDSNYNGDGILDSNSSLTGSPDLGSITILDPVNDIDIEISDSTIDLFAVSGTLIDMSNATKDLTFSAGTSTGRRLRVFNSGTFNIATGRTLTFAAETRLDSNGSGGNTFTFTGGGDVVFDGNNAGTGNGPVAMVLDGANMTINAPGGFGSSSTVTINSGSTLAINDIGALGSGTPALNGGTFDVSGVAGYSTPAGQTLAGVGTVNGDYAHGDGFLKPGDTSNTTPTAGTLTFGNNLEINGGTYVFDMNATPGGDDLIAVTGLTTLTSGTVMTNFLGAAPAAGQTYTVLTSTGGFSGPASNLTVEYPGRAPDPTLSINGNSLEFVTPAAVIANVTWTGATNGVWDVETTQNWDDGAFGTNTYFEGDNVTFDDTATGTTAVTLDQIVSPSSVVVNASANYSISGTGNISGSASLTKQGTGILTVSTTNDYTGGTTISGGAIDLFGGTLGTGTITLSGGSLLRSAGPITNDIAVTASTTNTYEPGFDTSGSNSQAHLDGSLSGTGTLSIANNTDNVQSVDLRADNSAFSGTLQFTGNSVNTVATGNWIATRFRDAEAAGDNADYDLGDIGARLGKTDLGDVTFQFGSLSGGSASTAGSPTAELTGQFGGGFEGDTTYVIGASDTSTTFGGLISDGQDNGDAGGELTHITKVGTGTLTLTYENTYSGDTTVEEGTLSITNGYLADAADVLLLSGATFDLDFMGTDTIDELFFDGLGQATGTWGALGSGAANESSFFTGDGLLMVSTFTAASGDFDMDNDVDGADFLLWQTNPGVGNLADWQATYGTSPATANLASVPEPGTLVLYLLAGLALPLRRRVA